MADKKISALTASALPLAGTEVLPIVQSGSTVKVAVSDLTAGRAVSATQLTASTGNFIVGTTAKGVTTGSAIPLGFGVNNTVTAMTIDTASKVGIGTTTPVDLLSVSNGSIGVSIGGSGAGLQMGRIAMYSSALGAGFTNYGGEIRSFSGAGIDVSDLRFYTANGAPTAERMRIGSTGDITATTGNLVIGTAGKGIDFSANTNALGMTSELLNWYEQGTFTPAWGGSTTDPTNSYTSRAGRYTRIGDMVYCWVELVTSASSGGSGNLQIKGLPFAAKDGALSAGFASGFSLNFPSGCFANSTTTVTMTATVPGVEQAYLGIATLGASSYLACTITYRIA